MDTLHSPINFKNDDYSLLDVDTIEPVNYLIFFDFSCLDIPTYITSVNAKETIHINIKRPVLTIELNSVDIHSVKAKLTYQNGKEKVPLRIEYLKVKIVLCFDCLLLPDTNAILEIEYIKKVYYSGSGILPRLYQSLSHEEARCSIYTQFEPCSARTAFPCWDQPQTKSTFQLELLIPSYQIAISNTPIESKETMTRDPANVLVRFKKTPLMSAYLLGFCIGEFDFVSVDVPFHDPNVVLPIRMYTPVGSREEGSFSLDIARKSILLFNEKFNLPYHLPKLDLVY
eukprot:TRINITY_DN5062_c0_g1_i1.p1 TRINITY_DN5062_c0_g1~~TRINITY_DN5062_c0_g1_i1.p1  ORF type:complete len:285 (+),score=39.91 TRINITY_DN5062_c0_g1_i1:36-890(+)